MDKARVLRAAGIEIVERDEDTIELAIATPEGVVSVMADLVLLERSLIMERVHVEGRGLTLGLIRRLAKVFGEVEDVEEVIVHGGTALWVRLREAILLRFGVKGTTW